MDDEPFLHDVISQC